MVLQRLMLHIISWRGLFLWRYGHLYLAVVPCVCMYESLRWLCLSWSSYRQWNFYENVTSVDMPCAAIVGPVWTNACLECVTSTGQEESNRKLERQPQGYSKRCLEGFQTTKLDASTTFDHLQCWPETDSTVDCKFQSSPRNRAAYWYWYLTTFTDKLDATYTISNKRLKSCFPAKY
jgi:hypothetical protein